MFQWIEKRNKSHRRRNEDKRYPEFKADEAKWALTFSLIEESNRWGSAGPKYRESKIVKDGGSWNF